MRKFLTIVAATGALALVSVAATTNADARWRGGGIAAGVIGGIAVGAAIAGANNGSYYNNGPYAYDQGYAYDQAPAYGYDQGPGYYDRPYGYRYGGSSCDRKNLGRDQQLQGSC